jgi:hypothetical protein
LVVAHVTLFVESRGELEAMEAKPR